MDKRMNLLLLKLGFLLTDLALINLGYVLAFVLKFGWDIPHYNFVAYISTWPWLSLSALCFFCFSGSMEATTGGGQRYLLRWFVWYSFKPWLPWPCPSSFAVFPSPVRSY